MKNIVITLVTMFLLSACILSPRSFDEEKWATTVRSTKTSNLYKNNRSEKGYVNPWLEAEGRGFLTFLRWRLSKSPEFSEAANNNLPKVQYQALARLRALPEEADCIIWVGHATFLLRIDGDYWLTDPIFSDRAFLPKRLTPPAFKARDLKHLDGKLNVIISHNHYDHLDEQSLKGLPAGTRYYVPLGLKAYLTTITDGNVVEMDWWQSTETAQGGRLTCLPAQHWSRRLFQGYNKTLWASYMLEYEGRTIYFGGDSGYFKGYEEFGRKYKNIDYALLPITAYEPRWFMHYPHMNTQEAIRAFQDLGADHFIPTQWGTFHLGDNPPGLPKLELRKNIELMQLNAKRFHVLDIGEILILE